jgi:hypothetical protein
VCWFNSIQVVFISSLPTSSNTNGASSLSTRLVHWAALSRMQLQYRIIANAPFESVLAFASDRTFKSVFVLPAFATHQPLSLLACLHSGSVPMLIGDTENVRSWLSSTSNNAIADSLFSPSPSVLAKRLYQLRSSTTLPTAFGAITPMSRLPSTIPDIWRAISSRRITQVETRIASQPLPSSSSLPARPLVSIIVIGRNRGDLLQQALQGMSFAGDLAAPPPLILLFGLFG